MRGYVTAPLSPTLFPVREYAAASGGKGRNASYLRPLPLPAAQHTIPSLFQLGAKCLSLKVVVKGVRLRIAMMGYGAAFAPDAAQIVGA